MNEAILLLGSNAGDRIAMIENAKLLLTKEKINIIKQSSLYETEAWGLEDQPVFLNQVVIAKTDLNAAKLLNTLLEIEHQMGRIRIKKWEQRCIDIDILFFNDAVINDPEASGGLKVPHPHLHERRFTLIPLNELVPSYLHPVFNKTISELLDECNDDKEVKRLS